MSGENQLEKEDITKLAEFFDLLHKIDQRTETTEINRSSECVNDVNV
jgi:hypothetical protein